jgi:polyisoprenoid-binding protein YceI
MKRMMLLAAMAATVSAAQAQKYMTRTGKVIFFSATSVENIEAVNNEAAAALDAGSGELLFQVPIKSFKFEKSLMQEHFNENYMESDKFPKAIFKGNIGKVPDLSKDGSYPVTAKGKLTIHGVTKDVSIPGTLTVKGGAVTSAAKFKVATADYGIKIPSVVATKIAKEIEITVNSVLSAIK